MSHEVDDLYNMIVALEAKQAALIEIVQGIEWVDDQCPACYRPRKYVDIQGHFDGCALERLANE